MVLKEMKAVFVGAYSCGRPEWVGTRHSPTKSRQLRESYSGKMGKGIPFHPDEKAASEA